mmetsp:Transcript_13548/g.21231  ORF Transcript_13548/g.21231 Transcript_13548/m.21231 type:complete len:568 (+) Transcript_13548:39-1742(+)
MAPPNEPPTPPPAGISQLTAMGFDEELAARALTAANGNVELACEYCLNGNVPEPSSNEEGGEEENFSIGFLSQGVEASRGALVESFMAMDEEALRNNLDLEDAPELVVQFISGFESAATDGSMNLEEFRRFLAGFLRDRVIRDLFAQQFAESFLQDMMRGPGSPFPHSVVETMRFPTKDEMVELMTNHFELLIPILTNGFFKVWDRDHDGSLTIKELLVTINMIKEVPGDELGPFIVGKFFFEVADSDSNGRLDCSEMADFLSEILSVPFSLVRPILEVVKAVVKGPAMSEASKGFMESLKVLDTNHDGLLSAEEAVSLFAKEPEQTATADARLSETLAAAEPALAQARAELQRVLVLKFELSQRESAPVAEVANALVGAAAGHATQQLDEVRPMLDGMLQEMATAFPFPTQQVLPVFHGLVQQAYGLVRSTACRRCVVAFCNILDKNGDGLVRAADLRAMLELLAPAGEGGVVARISALFKIFDANDNGQLSKEELELMVGKLLDLAAEYIATIAEIVKRLVLGNLEPLLQLVAGMVGDGTSFSYAELLNLQNAPMGPMLSAMPFM